MFTDGSREPNPRPRKISGPPRAPGLIIGLGLGGFIDGIVAHQLLRWHHMLTGTGDHPASTVSGLDANIVADGFFHLATWILVIAGTVLMLAGWRAGRIAPAWREHLGLVLAGWGIFNLVEGIVDHHILQIHHVRDDLGGPLGWDLGFLAVGALLVLTGTMLLRRRRQRKS